MCPCSVNLRIVYPGFGHEGRGLIPILGLDTPTFQFVSFFFAV